MDAERWRVVRRIIEEAGDLEPSARHAFLARACGSDADLRAEVESLLDVTEEAAVRLDAAIPLDPAPREAPGSPSSSLLSRLAEHGLRRSRYRVEGEVARGGMGAILRVWDDDLRRNLAMKVILGRADSPPTGETPPVDPRELARFLEEAQVTGQLDHPGIVPVHELGLDADGRAYFTMKLVKGRDLKAIFDLVFEAREGWNETRALNVLLKVCEAMAYAHKKGVIHRDLKPANVMVGSYGEVYVMDWGLARVLGQADRHDLRLRLEGRPQTLSLSTERSEEREGTPDSPLITMDGDVVGTPCYMSPEQARGEVEQLSARSDVYAIGSMLYHLLARQMSYVPAGAKVSNRTVLVMLLQGPPKPLHELRRDVPVELAAICEKAMARDTTQRYADTLELAEDLRAYLERRVVRAYETGAVAELRKWVGRNRGTAAAGLAALFALIAGLAASALLYRTSEESAARLAAKLIESNLQRGRVLSRTGDLRLTEPLLWREHLLDPDSPHTLWALRELYARHPCSALVPEHDAAARTCAVSPRGDLYASGAYDGCISLWQPGSLSPRATLKAHASEVSCLAFHPTGALLASGGAAGELALWDVDGNRPLRTLAGHEKRTTCLCFNPEGSLLASASEDGLVHVFEIATGQCRATFLGDGESKEARHPWSAVAFSPDGRVLAAAGADKKIRLWQDLAAEPRLLVDQTGGVASLAFGLDGTRLYSASGSTIGAWDTESGACLARWPGLNNTLRAISVSPDGRLLAAGGWKRIDLWNLTTREIDRSIPMSINKARNSSLSWCPDSRGIMSANGTGGLRLWDGAPLAWRRRLGGHEEQACARFSPDGNTIATGDGAGLVRLWNAHTGELRGSLSGHTQGVRSLDFRRDGTLLASGSGDGRVRLWNLATMRELRSSDGHLVRSLSSVAFRPDGQLVAYCSDRGAVELHDTTSGERVASLQHGSAKQEVLGVAFSPDGATLVSVARDDRLRLWSGAGEPRGEISAPGTLWSPAFSADGRRFAAGGWAASVYIWDAASARLEAVLEGEHDRVLWCIAFNPVDSNLLASASDDGTVRLWDVPSRRCLAVFDEFGLGGAFTADFSPDGNMLVAAGDGSDVYVWDLTHPDQYIAGNTRFQIEQHRAELGSRIQETKLMAWAEDALTRSKSRREMPSGR